MALIRKIHSKVGRAAGEVQWYKHANPKTSRDHEMRMGSLQDPGHSEETEETIQRKAEAFCEAIKEDVYAHPLRFFERFSCSEGAGDPTAA